MDWFEKLFGFKESSRGEVYKNIIVEDDIMKSLINNRSYHYGKLDVLSLSDLRVLSSCNRPNKSQLIVEELVGDVQHYHSLQSSQGAVFQAASQFNLLEMVSPRITPDDGVTRYEFDYTQGPACAIACGAGTVYRNYFTEVNGRVGQSSDNQINCLDNLERYFENDRLKLWEVKNGYAFANTDGLKYLSTRISEFDQKEYEKVKGLVKVGIQWNSQVTISNEMTNVTQVYCSALPVAYSHIESFYWEKFAKLILESIYESTIRTALLNFALSGNNKLYLTLVGGGAFGNEEEWIIDSVSKVLSMFSDSGLHISFVSYGSKSDVVSKIIDIYNYNLN